MSFSMSFLIPPSTRSSRLSLVLLFLSCIVCQCSASACAVKPYTRIPGCSASMNSSIITTHPDINLGSTWALAIEAAFCQLLGYLPTPSNSQYFITQAVLRGNKYRRIDLYRDIITPPCCTEGLNCSLNFSIPYTDGPGCYAGMPIPLNYTCKKRAGLKRDVGAVFMYNHQCAVNHPTNCNATLVNNHVVGFGTPSSLFGNGLMDLYNPAWWVAEFRDAAYAGLQFLLPNCYGWKDSTAGIMKSISAAAAATNGQVKVGLFDDVSEWGRPWYDSPSEGLFMSPAPDFNNPPGAAQRMYPKWRRFFSGIGAQHWYRQAGRPVVYMYNAWGFANSGTYRQVTTTVGLMKQQFAKDFGVTPFVYLDAAYPPRDSAGNQVADAVFMWDTLANPAATPGSLQLYTNPTTNKTYAHSMPRWDSRARDGPSSPFYPRVFKDGAILSAVLDATAGVESLVLATWNDLGEGTAINRADDYFFSSGSNGTNASAWQRPDYFMSLIRSRQCS